jgi:hypothetical protein
MNIKHQYVVDDQNHKIAVQLDIDTFRQIEDVLENYALYNLIKVDMDTTTLSLEAARMFYPYKNKQLSP